MDAGDVGVAAPALGVSHSSTLKGVPTDGGLGRRTVDEGSSIHASDGVVTTEFGQRDEDICIALAIASAWRPPAPFGIRC